MNDIDEMKTFRAELDQPPPGALARARVRAVTAAPRGSATGVRRRLALAAVTFAVAGVALGVGLAVNRDTPGTVGLPPDTTPTSSAPAGATAADIAERLAVVAEAGPPAPAAAPGQLIRSTTRVMQNGAWTTQTAGFEREGLIQTQNEYEENDSYQHYLAEQRLRLAQTGGDIEQPTTEFLASLDARPAHLRELIAVAQDCPPTGCPGDFDWTVREAAIALARKGDVVLPPTVRAGLLRLLGSLPGTTAERVTVDGKSYWSLRYPHDQYLYDVYFDETTGRISGIGVIQAATRVDPSACASAGKVAGNRGTTATAIPPGCQLTPLPPSRHTILGQEIYESVLTTP